MGWEVERRKSATRIWSRAKTGAETTDAPAIKRGGGGDHRSGANTPKNARDGYLLIDRKEPGHIFERKKSTAPANIDRFMKDDRIGFTQDDWNEIREAVESGTLIEEPDEIFFPSGIAITTAAPRRPPPSISLPEYGTSLSVTGRKKIGLSFNSKRFINLVY